MQDLPRLAALIDRHTPADGSFDTAIPHLGLIRSSAVTQPLHTLYEPSCCIVAQGRKRVTLGGRAWAYDPAHYLVVGLDLPVIGAVVDASPERPYLSLRLQLDRPMLAEMLLQQEQQAQQEPQNPTPATDRGQPAMAVGEATPALVDAAVRLLQLLDTPDDRAALAPLIEREMTHRLLHGSQGALLRQLARGSSRVNRVQKAVAHIRRHFAEPFAIDDLAAVADMSASTFHAHFKVATRMSPLQFRTHIRLQEARRLMLAEGLGAAEAGFRVGYESPSQFSRDYGRLFAAPPRQDVARLRAGTAG
ncbi:helix-turn-helix domain-containing protein [Xylophilus sp. Kf1]|nr:helix-turn-helix domain-containing protein [Xylophilus sp. Kf1]